MSDLHNTEKSVLRDEALKAVIGGAKKNRCEHNWKRISKFGETPQLFRCTKCGDEMSAG